MKSYKCFGDQPKIKNLWYFLLIQDHMRLEISKCYET